MEKYLKEADVPLVGCFANDTENRFTAGIDNNSEEIKKKKFTSVTLSHSKLYVMFCHFPALFYCGRNQHLLCKEWFKNQNCLFQSEKKP